MEWNEKSCHSPTLRPKSLDGKRKLCDVALGLAFLHSLFREDELRSDRRVATD